MRQDWCPGCAAPLKSQVFTQLLEADEALVACQRSYDALAATWTQWSERRAGLAEQLAAQRPATVPQPAAVPQPTAVPQPAQTHAAAAPTVPVASQPLETTPAPVETTPTTDEVVAPSAPTPSPVAEPEPARASAAPGFDQAAVPSQTSTHTPAATQPSPVHVARPAPTKPARPPRRRMSEVFTAPVLLGVSGASLMIAAAIVAVAITWATATPVVRGLLVLVVAGAVGALAAWLRRLHLVITSGSVGIVSMGFAGTSAVAFLSESPTLSPYSAAVAFMLAGAAGIVLARLKLAWVGPSAAVALAGASAALTITFTSQAADAVAMWAWTLTGVATAFALAATYALWPWKSAQHIVVWAGLGWVGVTGGFAALWLWFGDVSVGGSVAAVVPIVALGWLARRWQPVPVVTAAVLVTMVAPGIAYVAGASAWQQFVVLAGALAVLAGLGGRLPAAMRRPLLGGLAPGFVVAWVATVGAAVIGLILRLEVLLNGGLEGSQPGLALDVWMGAAALLLAAAVAALRTWNLPELRIPDEAHQAVVISGPLAAIAAVTVLTVTASELVVDAWTPWVWSLTGVALALVVGLTRKVWAWDLAKHCALGASLVWVGIVGVVVAIWAWSGDLSVAGSFAGLLPVVALIAMARWLPRASVITAVLLATLVAPSIAFAAGLTPWQQLTAVTAVIVLTVVAGIKVSNLYRGAIAIGVAPALAGVALWAGSYAISSVFVRVAHAMTTSVDAQGFYVSTPGTVDIWAGVTALAAGLAVAGVRWWRLRELGPGITGWLRAGGIVGALLIVAGVAVVAAAVADMAARQYAHPALASALSGAAIVLLLARHLWVDQVVKNVSSASGVVFAGLAGVHGIWALASGPLPVWAGLGIALAPVAVLAGWGIKRPGEGTGLAALLATGVAAALTGALGGPGTLALAVAVGLAAVAAWTVQLLPARQQEPVLVGVSPALGWGVVAGLWSVIEVTQWVDTSRWNPAGWVAVAALATAVALAATRTGPWRARAGQAERIGAVLVLVSAPVAFVAGATLTVINEPGLALGSAIGGAVVAAAGLAWWRDRWARRLTRVGAVLWITAAGVMGWINVGHSSWHLATTLVLSVVALALLVLASRWWPRPALAPTALLLTGAPMAVVARFEWGITAAGALMLVGAALVMALLTRVPVRMRYIGVVGALPALIVGTVSTVVVAIAAAVEALAGGRSAMVLDDHWWALGLVIALGLALALIGRLALHRVIAAAANLALGVAVVATVVVATAAFARLAAPDQPGAQARLLLTPTVAVVLGAAVVAWTVWSERALVAGTAGPTDDARGADHAGPGRDARQPLDAQRPDDARQSHDARRAHAPTIARWGALGWVAALGVALHVWIYQADVYWLAGAGLVVAIAVGLGAVGTRWPYLGLTPAVTLVTVLPFVVVPVTTNLAFAASACLAMVLVAAAVWVARSLTVSNRGAVVAGLIPAVLGAMVPALMAVLLAFTALAEHLLDTGSLSAQGALDELTWWHVGVFAAGAVAVLAWRETQQFRGWLFLSTLVVAAAALPVIWAVASLSVGALLLLFAGKWLRSGSVAAGIAVAVAMVWSVGSDTALGVTATTATVIAGTVALGWRTRALTWGAVVGPVTALIAGVSIARALDAANVAVPAGVGLSMVAVLALVSADRDRLREPVAYTAVVLTVIAPLFAHSTAMMGLAYVLGAATWWRLFTAGLAWAKWMTALTASAGAAALLAAVNIQIIEAYTAVPAAALLLIGVQWMRDRPQLRSTTALAPGLGAALVPSYLALVLEPDALWRTIALIGALIVLALVGLRLRWFAPILGTAVTAVVLSVLQIIAGGNLVVRLIAFAVVGALLLGIASYFERLKELR